MEKEAREDTHEKAGIRPATARHARGSAAVASVPHQVDLSNYTPQPSVARLLSAAEVVQGQPTRLPISLTRAS